MKKIYIVHPPPRGSRLHPLSGYLDTKIGVEARVASNSLEVNEAYVLLGYSLREFTFACNGYISSTSDTAKQYTRKEHIPEGFDEAWYSKDACARTWQYRVEILASAVLNHFYVLQEHLLLLTKELQTRHGVDVAPHMSLEALGKKKWSERLRQELGQLYEKEKGKR
ncbi:hypothetical protein LCGC14_2864180, partial [marine sediment metagenome]